MEYDYQPQIFGLYSKKSQKVNGHSFYTSEDYKGKYGIWWGRTAWWIGSSREKGKLRGFSYDSKRMNTACPQVIHGQNWLIWNGSIWKHAGKGLTIRCVKNESKFVPSTQQFSGTANSTASANSNSIF